VDLAVNDKRLPFLSRIDGKIVFFKFVPVWRDDLTGGTGIYWTKKGPAFELAKGGIGQ
jgi:hypothetical protein